MNLESQPSTTNTTPTKSLENFHAAEKKSEGDDDYENIHKMRKKNDGSCERNPRENITFHVPKNANAMIPEEYSQGEDQENLISHVEASGQIQMEEEQEQEQKQEQEQEQEREQEQEQPQEQPQPNFLPVYDEIDPHLLEKYLDDLKFFRDHCETKATVDCFRATQIPQLEFNLPQISLSLFDWLSLFYPMVKLRDSMSSYHNMLIFDEVVFNSEFYSLKIESEKLIPKINEEIFFPSFFQYLLEFQLSSLPIEVVEGLLADGDVTGVFFTPHIKAFKESFKKNQIKMSPTHFAISCYKKQGSKLEFYFAKNSQEPLSSNVSNGLSKLESKKNSRNPVYAYNIAQDGSLPIFNHHQENEFIFQKLLFFLCFQKFLKEYLETRNIFDPENLFCHYEIDFRSSSNPIFWTSFLNLNSFDCPIDSFCIDFSEKSTPFFLVKEKEGFNTVTSVDFLTSLSHKILLYSPVFKKHSLKAKNYYKNDSRNKSRFQKLRNEMSKIPEAFLIDLNNMENWKIPQRLIDEEEDEKGKKKPDVNKLLTKPLIRQILRNETTVQAATGLVLELAQENCDRGEIISGDFASIIAKLNTVNVIKEAILREQAKSQEIWRNRRETLAYFLTEYELKGKNCRAEIESVLLEPKCEEMLAALKYFFKYSMGVDFITTWLNLIFCFDDDNSDTKQKGIFLRGKSNFGKSFAIQILLLPFKVFEISNSNCNTVPSELIENPDAQKTKVYNVRAHYYLLDDFNGEKFSRPTTMPIQDFNEIFNFQKEVRKLNIKGGSIHLQGNAGVILCTHHKPDLFLNNYDDSFKSRFSSWTDLEQPIIFSKKKGCPEKESNESQERYIIRLRQLNNGFVEDKPLFPLNAESTANCELKKSIIEKAIYSDDEEELPTADPLKILMNHDEFDRKKVMMKNPLSKDWASFPEISRVKCSYLSHQIMMLFADKLWLKMKNEDREIRFPLRSRRSLVPKNIEKYGLIFEHGHFSSHALKPSEIIRYPELIESPQAICWCLVFKNENILKNPIGKAVIDEYKQLFEFSV